MRAYDDAGNVLDAVFHVEPSDGRLSVVFASRGGGGVRGALRNPDYLPALGVILARLASLGATLSDAHVDSQATRSLPLEKRRIIDQPLRLDRTTSAEKLRTSLTRAASRVGRQPGAKGPGNPTKRLRLTVEVPGFNVSDADRLEVALGHAPSDLLRFEREAGDLLRDLVGVELTTIAGSTNRIVRVRPPTVVVATDRSPEGSPVPIADLARAMETLDRQGSVEISPDTVGYRSAFVGAVLRSLPDTSVDPATPPRIVLTSPDDQVQRSPEGDTSRLPAPGPFQGDLDRPVTMRQRREQRKLRRALLAGRDDAPCLLCGETYPARFLWASHVKRRSAATQEEARDLPYVAMLACIFGCDALFEDGYVAVRDGVVIGTRTVDRRSMIGLHVSNLEDREIADYGHRARYFEWHFDHVFRS